MPIKQSAKKALRQTLKRRQRNLAVLKKIKSLVKKTQKTIVANKLNEAEDFLKKTVKALDKAAKKNIIHKNTANRRKSKLMKKINALKKKKS